MTVESIAQALYEQVLRSYEQQLGADHPDTLKTRHNLALLYQNQSKDKQYRTPKWTVVVKSIFPFRRRGI